MTKIYQFTWDCGRCGVVTGVFVADDAMVQDAMGKRVDLGEALGKHSEVMGKLEEADLVVLSDSPSDVEVFTRILPRGSGYNPLNYLD